ncbi:hypothetical protein, partial [Klebsiella pneumoniae]|uniref:hypothetical protein n=1 Tax=Klebsiella pneumoniae TaxID=573 RepID=UPI001C3C990A
TGGDVPLRKAEYGVLSLPTMIGEDPYKNSVYQRSEHASTVRHRHAVAAWYLLFRGGNDA